MKAIIHPDYTEIFPSNEEVKQHCGIGQGADCCIWLVMGSQWECLYYNRVRGHNLEGETLEGRWKAGKTVAKRDGCDKVKNFAVPTLLGEAEF